MVSKAMRIASAVSMTIVILSFNLYHNLGLIWAPNAKFWAPGFYGKNGVCASLTLSWHHHAVNTIKKIN